MPRALAPATPSSTRPRRPPFWRGAAGALALAAWSVAGVIWAALALAPVALERGPRGRARARRLDGRPALPLAPGLVAAEVLDVEAEAGAAPARAAGEAFPG